MRIHIRTSSFFTTTCDSTPQLRALTSENAGQRPVSGRLQAVRAQKSWPASTSLAGHHIFRRRTNETAYTSDEQRQRPFAQVGWHGVAPTQSNQRLFDRDQPDGSQGRITG